MKGKFLVLEGMDGCGKSTQADALVAWMSDQGHQPLHVREPGTTSVGENLRQLLLDPDRQAWDPKTEALLFFAARTELLRQCVVPALKKGQDVVCERFTPSTLAYQGHEPEMADFILSLDAMLIPPSEQPQLTLILDLDPEVAFRRTHQRGSADGMEKRGVDFQRQVRQGYLRYAKARPLASKVLSVGELNSAQVTEVILPIATDFFAWS